MKKKSSQKTSSRKISRARGGSKSSAGHKKHVDDHVCRKCNSSCCRYFCFQIDTPDDYEEFEKIRWYVCHNNVRVHVDEGDWYIEIVNVCNMLDARGMCRDYENRPLICRSHTSDSCECSGERIEYQVEFTSPEQVTEYAIKALGAKEYERQRKIMLRRCKAS